MEIEGKLHAKFDIQQITGTFRKREFVIEFVENPMYPQYVKFETIQDRTNLIDQFEIGDPVKVSFNLKGREWTNPEGQKLYFTTLDAWRISRSDGQQDGGQQSQSGSSGEQPVYDMADIAADDGDDLPF